MLELNFCITIGNCCKTITLEDITGDYDATTNTGGWGAPNPVQSDAVQANLSIIDPNGNTYIIDVLTEVVNSTNIEITSDEIGLTADLEIPSGHYEFSLSVNVGTLGTPDWVTFNSTQLFYCLEEQRVKQLIASTEFDDCKCNDGNSLTDILDIWTYLMALKNAACCGKVSKFEELLEIINSLLDSNPCKNC